MSTRFSAHRLIRIGPGLTLGATVVALSLMLIDTSVTEITSILLIAFPLSVLVALLGIVVTIAGAVGWALHSSKQELAKYGVALTGLAIVCFLAIDRIQFGFDDPRILFAQAITGTPLIVGILFFLFAGFQWLRTALK